MCVLLNHSFSINLSIDLIFVFLANIFTFDAPSLCEIIDLHISCLFSHSSEKTCIKLIDFSSQRFNFSTCEFLLSCLASECQYKPLYSIAKDLDGTYTSSSFGSIIERSDGCASTNPNDFTKFKTSIWGLEIPFGKQSSHCDLRSQAIRVFNCVLLHFLHKNNKYSCCLLI